MMNAMTAKAIFQGDSRLLKPLRNIARANFYMAGDVRARHRPHESNLVGALLVASQVLVHYGRSLSSGLQRIENRFQFLILNLNGLQSLVRCFDVDRRHRGYRLTHVSHFFFGKYVFIF